MHANVDDAKRADRLEHSSGCRDVVAGVPLSCRSVKSLVRLDLFLMAILLRAHRFGIRRKLRSRELRVEPPSRITAC
jgi:hypothetical protein